MMRKTKDREMADVSGTTRGQKRRKMLSENMDIVDKAAIHAAVASGVNPKTLRMGPDMTPNLPGKATGSGAYARFAQNFVRMKSKRGRNGR